MNQITLITHNGKSRAEGGRMLGYMYPTAQGVQVFPPSLWACLQQVAPVRTGPSYNYKAKKRLGTSVYCRTCYDLLRNSRGSYARPGEEVQCRGCGTVNLVVADDHEKRYGYDKFESSDDTFAQCPFCNLLCFVPYGQRLRIGLVLKCDCGASVELI